MDYYAPPAFDNMDVDLGGYTLGDYVPPVFDDMDVDLAIGDVGLRKIVRYDMLTGEKTAESLAVNEEHLQGSGISTGPLDLSENVKHLQSFFDGATVDDVQGNVVSDGFTITATVEALGGGDVSYKVDGGFQVLDSTPAASTILTPGTDSAPILNYMFIDSATNTFTSNTTGFPEDSEHVPLAVSLVGSASLVYADGTYKTHQWNDHIHLTGGNGHVSHINRWIRAQNATWLDGVALSHTGSGTTTVGLSATVGSMLQLHEHGTEAIANPATAYIPNHETTAYAPVSNLADITTDSTGASINNKYTPLVIFYAHSAIPGDAKLFINKPNGTYNSEPSARADADKHTDYSIPKEFTGTAFLIHRLIMRNASGTVTIFDGVGDDLRGLSPNTASGYASVSGSTFLSSLFRVQDTTDPTKQIAFDVSEVTTATTRTITMPDHDVDLGDIGTSSSPAWLVKTANYTAVAGENIQMNTTAAAYTLTLPATPSVNDRVGYGDYAGTFGTNKMIVARNGSNIMGLAENYEAIFDNEHGAFTYIDATQGWKLTP